ncbi:MAG: PEP-CTERM sorting domain-containing protein [Roseateles sp.]|uniref:PEP-CTERM sorting domain-containing protein n=1 Tax=Roseateles sp. TaxID=1971397 RepID=UPI004036E5A6
MLNLKTYTALATLLLAGAAGADTTNGFANGGFETPGGAVAAGWLTAPTGNPVMPTAHAHSGSAAVLLTVPNGFGASTLFQDSFAHGGLPALTAANVGDTPVLSFWVKGDVSPTGNIMFSLSYMGDNGSLWSSGNRFFQDDINGSSWTRISFQAAAIPADTKSLFLEINTAVGPLLDGRVNAVYLDDVQFMLTTAPVPEPETYALLIAGLGIVGAIARRRRA